jgi:uncharacterized integral membrane protein
VALVIANINKVTSTILVGVIIANLIVALVIANMNKVSFTLLLGVTISLWLSSSPT